jgi:hypothetical protein
MVSAKAGAASSDKSKISFIDDKIGRSSASSMKSC